MKTREPDRSAVARMRSAAWERTSETRKSGTSMIGMCQGWMQASSASREQGGRVATVTELGNERLCESSLRSTSHVTRHPCARIGSPAFARGTVAEDSVWIKPAGLETDKTDASETPRIRMRNVSSRSPQQARTGGQLVTPRSVGEKLLVPPFHRNKRRRCQAAAASTGGVNGRPLVSTAHR